MPGVMIMLDLHELQVFLVAAETENFSETGRILQISQPAVSGHIHALEQHLAVQLFDRTGRNIKLNDMGQAFVPVARNLLKEARRAEEFIAARQGTLAGQLTIACSTAAGKYVLPRLMARFMDRYPAVKLTCDVGPRGYALDRLAAGEIDLAVSSLRVPRRAVEYAHFVDDVLILIAPPPHELVRRAPLVPHDLIEFALIVREPSSGTAITLNRALAKHDMSIDMLPVRLTLCNTEAIVQAVSEGIGPAFVSRLSALTALRQEQVVEVPVSGLNLIQHLYLVRHTGFRASEVQTRFWDFALAPENRDLHHFHVD